MAHYLRHGLLGILCLAAAQPAAAADGGKLFPDNAEMVLTVNFRQIFDSALFQKYVYKSLEPKINLESLKIFNMLGLNPVKEITSLTFVAPGGTDPTRWMVIVQGAFNPPRVHATIDQLVKAQPEMVAVHSDGAVRLYESLAKGENKYTPKFYALLDKNTIVASPRRDFVEDAVAKQKGLKGLQSKDGFMTLIGQQDIKQSIWLAIVVSDAMKEQLSKNGAQGFGNSLQSLSGGLLVNDDVRVSLRLQTNDPKAARQIRQQIEAGKAIAILAVSVNEELKAYAPLIMDVLNSFRIGEDRGTISVELLVTGNLIEKGLPKPPKQ